MRRAAGRLTRGLVLMTGTGAGASVILAVLVMTSVFAAMAAPRQSLADRTRALDAVFASVPALGRSVVATADYFSVATTLGAGGGLDQRIGDGQLQLIRAGIARRLIAAGIPLQPSRARWSGVSSGQLTLAPYPRSVRATAPPKVQVLYRGALSKYARLTAGAMPARSSLTYSPAGPLDRFEVAVTAATAARFSLRPGSVLHLGRGLALVVTGLIRPVRPGSAFWTEDPGAAAASFVSAGRGGGGYWQGSVFITRPELAHLESALDISKMTLTWDFPMRLRGVTADQAGALADSLRAAAGRAGIIRPRSDLGYETALASAEVVTGVAGPLAQFVQAEDQVATLLSLIEVSLAIVGAVVLLLGGRLLAERRGAELRVMRGRGAALGQLAGLGLRAGLVVVLPAAALGAVAAVMLTPGGDEPLAWWLASMTTIFALAGMPWLIVRQASASGQAAERADRPLTRTERSRRLVADLTLVAAAAGAMVVLRQQGLSGAGTNWYPSAAPALVAIPAAILAVRCYPRVVRWLVRLAGRRSGVTAFVGLARASRTSATAVLPVFALVLVLTVVGFGAMLRAAVGNGDTVASWRAAGADAVVDATQLTGPLSTQAQRAISAAPGVRGSCPLAVLPGLLAGGASVSVVVMDPARYARFTSGTPLAAFPARALAGQGGPAPPGVPVLASPSVAAALRGGQLLVAGRALRVRVAKVVISPASQLTGTDFVVITAQALGGRPHANVLLLSGPAIGSGRLRALVRQALRGATVSFRSKVLDSLVNAPLPRSAFVTFAQGALAAAAFGAVIVLIMLALGARPRELTLARLFTMGLSPAQASRLVLAEVLPSIVAAAAGGTVAALALVPLLAPAIDLSLFTGSAEPVAMRADVGVLLYLAGILLALSVLTLFAQSAATRLRGVARALRVGE